MHHYAFHPGDYMLDTAHLDQAQDLCYRRALDLYYVSETPLTTDRRALSKRLRVSEDILTEVLEEFFTEEEDGWHHQRCDREITHYQSKAASAKEAGKIGGKARLAAKPATDAPAAATSEADAKRSLSERQANANQSLSERQADAKRTLSERQASACNHEPGTSNQEPRTRNHQPGTTNQEPRTTNRQPRPTNPQPRTTNPQPRTRTKTTNRQPRARNPAPHARARTANPPPPRARARG